MSAAAPSWTLCPKHPGEARRPVTDPCPACERGEAPRGCLHRTEGKAPSRRIDDSGVPHEPC
jgi:hypothetical protein